MASTSKSPSAVAGWAEFRKRIKDRYSFKDAEDILNEVSGKSVLVIGETIIDEYAYGEPMSKSPKGALLTMRYVKSEYFAGGILACANHVAGFCGKVRLVTCLGQKRPMAGFVKKNILPNVNPNFFYRQGATTTLNRRITINGTNQRIIGEYHFDHSPLSQDLESDVLRFLEAEIPEHDLVLAVDYGHGFFTEKIISLLASQSKFLALNVQTNSTNFGFNPVYKFPRADYICLDEIEARLAAGSRFGEIKDIARTIAGRITCPKVSVTLGKNGALIFNENIVMDIPAFLATIVDSVGTGDAYLSVTAPCVAVGAPMEIVGLIGSIAGSIHVQTLCNKSAVGFKELAQKLKEVWK